MKSGIFRYTILISISMLALIPGLIICESAVQAGSTHGADFVNGSINNEGGAESKDQISGLTELFISANEDYKQGKYDNALSRYLRIYRSGIKNSGLFYNLGNTFYRTSKIGPAIWMWEKSLKLNPGDEQTVQNLQLAYSKISYESEPEEQHFLAAIFIGIADFFDADGWTVLVIISLWIFGIWLFILQMSDRAGLKRLSIYIVASFLLITLFCGIFAAVKYYQFNYEEYGIVLIEKDQVRSGPGMNNPILFPVYEGVKVKIENREGEWSMISLPNGYHGWVSRQSIGII